MATWSLARLIGDEARPGDVSNAMTHLASAGSGLDVSLQDIVDGLEEQLLVIDSEYCIRFANLAARRQLEGVVASLVGRRCYEALYGRDKPCEASLWDCPLAKVLQSGSPVSVTHREGASGTGGISEKYYEISVAPLRDSEGNIGAVVELRKDVTAEKRLEAQTLRRYHELLAMSQISAALSQSWALDDILNVGLDHVLQLVSGTKGGILLLDEETQTLSYRVHRGLSAKYTEEMSLKLGEGIAGKVAQTGEPVLCEDISVDPHAGYPVLISREGLRAFISVPLRAKGKILGVINVAGDTPRQFDKDDMLLLNSIGCELGVAVERARLYEQLAKGRETYRTLLRDAIVAQEKERNRIARELHDETRQTLSSLTLYLQVLLSMAQMPGTQTGELQPKLEEAQRLALHTAEEVGRIINHLRPAMLDDLGLVAAVRKYAETNLRPQGINVSVESRLKGEPLPPEVEVELFRIVQGGVSNVGRHAEAKSVIIELESSTKEVLLRIKDDGKGFDARRLGTSEEGGGLGLFTMKERARLLGGTCSVRTKPGAGTTVIVKVPVLRGGADAGGGVNGQDT